MIVNVFVVGNNLGTGWGENVGMDSQGIDLLDFVADCMDLRMKMCMCQHSCSSVVCSLVSVPVAAWELVP